MATAFSTQVKLEGRTATLRFEACRIALGGEFAGNVDLELSCDPEAAAAAEERLGVRLPGGEPSGPALGGRVRAGGIDLGFFVEGARLMGEPPEHVEILWSGVAIGHIAPVLSESVPIEQVARVERPPAPQRSSMPATSPFVPLATNRERTWYGVAAAIALLGGMASLSLIPLELTGSPLAWGGIALASVIGCGIALRLARTPYRQVWLDRDRRLVLVLEGRTRDPLATLAGAGGRSLDAFAHVRVFMRWQITTDFEREDQESWTVALEGPIAWAGLDGRVHLRGDVLPVASFRSGAEARRVAAHVAHQTGLGILDTGHDQTA